MTVVTQSQDLLDLIKDLQRQVRELRRSSLYGAAITQGSLDVRTPDGDVIMRAGEIPYGSSTAYGVSMHRANGTVQARFFDTTGGGGYWAMFDEAGNVLVSDDTSSGQGLATPYIPVQVMSYADVISPPTLITAGALTNTFRVHAQKQHPRVRCYLICNTDASAVGEVALNQGGVQISPTLPVAASTNAYMTIDGTVNGAHLSLLTVDVQARRVSGAGNFRLAVAWASGVQS